MQCYFALNREILIMLGKTAYIVKTYDSEGDLMGIFFDFEKPEPSERLEYKRIVFFEIEEE
jgi:hypothetical protein